MRTQRILSIEDVLPHRPPMRLLDELLDYGPEHVACGVTIRPESLFCDRTNGVPSWVGMEYMAQTACAYSGLDQLRRGVKPTIALLLGVRSYRVDTPLFAIGARLRVVAELQLRDENDLVAFDCTLYRDEVVLGRADVKAIRPKDPLNLR